VGLPTVEIGILVSFSFVFLRSSHIFDCCVIRLFGRHIPMPSSRFLTSEILQSRGHDSASTRSREPRCFFQFV
jgi:hypothetical protein